MATSKVEQGKAKKKRTVADIRAKKKAVTKKVTVQLDGELAGRIADLRVLHLAARDSDRLSNENDTAPVIEAEIEQLVKDSRESEIIFTFKSAGRFRYDELVTEGLPILEPFISASVKVRESHGAGKPLPYMARSHKLTGQFEELYRTIQAL